MKRVVTLLMASLLLICLMSSSTAAQGGDILDVASESGNFSTLLTALEAAGLDETLKGEGPFTVFAPTDDAFANLPEGTLDALLADPEGQLSQVLLYHVLTGEVPAETLITLPSAVTDNGEEITIVLNNGQLLLNDSVEVVLTDIPASNGIIHVINDVLIPPDTTPSELPDGGAQFNAGFLWLVLGLLALILGVAMIVRFNNVTPR